METKRIKNRYSGKQLIVLTFLRIVIGWHFLYEGLVKVYNPDWTAKDYLSGAVGIFAPFFKAMASSERTLNWIDILNEWGLVLIGISLFLGLLSNPAKLGGIILLTMYYLAYPPFPALGADMHVEGNYWIVNKNLIEIAALAVLYFFPTSRITGLDRYLFSIQNRKTNEKQQEVIPA